MDEKRIREEKEKIMDQDVQNLLTCLNTEADKIQAAVKKEDETKRRWLKANGYRYIIFDYKNSPDFEDEIQGLKERI